MNHKYSNLKEPIKISLEKKEGEVLLGDFEKQSTEEKFETVKQKIKKLNLSESEYSHLIEKIELAFTIGKNILKKIIRNNGSNALDHASSILLILIKLSENPSYEEMIIALLHDIIEDTNMTYGGVKDLFGTKIALGVLLLSKEPIENFISRTQKIQTDLDSAKIKKSKILDVKGFLPNEDYLIRKHNLEASENELEAEKLFNETTPDFIIYRKIKDCVPGLLNFKGLISDDYKEKKEKNPEKVTQLEKWAERKIKDLIKKYKWKRNGKYFKKMIPGNENNNLVDKFGDDYPCLNNLLKEAINFKSRREFNIELSIDEIKEVCLKAIKVKFIDRIDNLRTSELYTEFSEKNLDKAKSKITETETYFYEIVKEYDRLTGTRFYELIKEEVERLKKLTTDISIAKVYSSIRNKSTLIIDGEVSYETYETWAQKNP